jgi:WD40 repeat protein
MADLFISYSRHDQAFVRALVERLGDRGKEAWVDWEGIPPTAEFMQEIYAGIEGSDAFVFVISADSARSKVCRDEIAHAAEVGKRIVPILRGEPGEASLPEAVASRNWLILTDSIDLDEAANLVVEALDQDLEHVRRHTRLLEKALEWERADRDRSLLLRGSDLRAAEAWLAEAPAKPEPAPTPLHYEYVQASRAAATGRQRRLVGASGVGITVALALATLALIQRNHAVRERRTSESRLVAIESQSQLGNRDLGARLALAAYRIDPTPQARDSVFAALWRTAAVAGVIRVRGVTVVRFAPAGNRLAAGRADGTIDLFRGSPLRRELSLRLGAGAVHSLAFSADGTVLAAAGVDGKLALWRLEGATRAVRLQPPPGSATAVAFAPDGSLVVARPGGVAWWTVGDPAQRRQVSLPYPIDRLDVSKDGTVAAGGVVGMMLIRPRGRPVTLGKQQPVQDLAFADDGRLGFVEGTQPYEWTPGSSPRELGTAGATSIAFAPEGLAAAGTLVGRISLATPGGGRRPEMSLSPDAVVALAFDPQGGELAAADASRITLWRVDGGDLATSTSLDLAALDDLVMIGPHAFAAGGNGRLEQAGGGRQPLPVAGAPTGLMTLAASLDGRLLAAGGTGSRTVVAWTRTGPSASTLRPGGPAFHRADDIPTALAIAARDNVLAEATQHGTVDLWRLDAPPGAPTIARTGSAPLTALAAAPAGDALAAGARDGSIGLVDPRSGKTTRQTPLPEAQVVDLAFSADGRTLAAAGSDESVTLIRGTKVERTLRAGTAALDAVAFDPAGEAVAAGDEDGDLYLWRARDGLAAGPALPLGGTQKTKIVALSFDPTGSRLAVGLEDGSVVVVGKAAWNESEAIASLCGRLGGVLTAAERSVFLPGGRGTGACG